MAAVGTLASNFDVEGQRTSKLLMLGPTGMTNWIDYYRQDPTRAAVFNAAMTALSNAHYVGVVDAYDFRLIRNLVDVGGGHGRLISMILTAYPKMHGVLFDYDLTTLTQPSFGNRLLTAFESMWQNGRSGALESGYHRHRKRESQRHVTGCGTSRKSNCIADRVRFVALEATEWEHGREPAPAFAFVR